MKETEGSSVGMCRAAPTEKERTTETVAFSRHNGACREEMPENCTMARAAHECGATAGVSDLVQARRVIVTRADKKKWWDKKMAELEEDMKCNRQGDFFKKLKRLSGTRGILADTILDKAGQQLKTSEEKLARWKRHFEHTLNVHRQVAADLTELEHNTGSDTPGVTRKEVESVVMRLRNGKAAGDDRIQE